VTCRVSPSRWHRRRSGQERKTVRLLRRQGEGSNNSEMRSSIGSAFQDLRRLAPHAFVSVGQLGGNGRNKLPTVGNVVHTPAKLLPALVLRSTDSCIPVPHSAQRTVLVIGYSAQGCTPYSAHRARRTNGRWPPADSKQLGNGSLAVDLVAQPHLGAGGGKAYGVVDERRRAGDGHARP